jgi:hypothetical protein
MILTSKRRHLITFSFQRIQRLREATVGIVSPLELIIFLVSSENNPIPSQGKLNGDYN